MRRLPLFSVQVEGVLGRGALLTGLSRYLSDLQLSVAVEAELWAPLEEAGREAGSWPPPGLANTSLAQAMSGWTGQPGYPVISVTRQQEGAGLVVRLTQARYMSDGRGRVGEEVWWTVPVTWGLVPVGGGALDWQQAWLTTSNVSIDLPAATLATPLILNKQEEQIK